MEPIKLSDRKKFEIFIPKECDLDTVTRVIIRGRLFEERKTGKWIDETVTTGTTSGSTTIIRQYRCSVCGNLFGRIDDKFCGRCGARMEDEP